MDKKKKKYLFFIGIFVLALVFAYLLTSLVFNGEFELGSSRFNVYFDNLDNQTNLTAEIDSNDLTTIHFDANLENFTDECSFTVDIVNGGNIDAMIDSIELPDLEEYSSMFNVSLKYFYGREIAQYDSLKANKNKEVQFTISYNQDMDLEDLPTELDEIDMTLTINYVIADEHASGSSIRLFDNNENSKIDEEDIIFIDDEGFYVLSNKNGTIRALAMYNLMVGNYNDVGGQFPIENPSGIQDPKARGMFECTEEDEDCNQYGLLAFSESKYWDEEGLINLNHSDNLMYPYLMSYKEYLGDIVTDVTLPTNEDIVDFALYYNDGDYSIFDEDCFIDYFPDWFFDRSYRVNYTNGSEDVGYVDYGGYIGLSDYRDGLDEGIRPLIVLNEKDVPSIEFFSNHRK